MSGAKQKLFEKMKNEDSRERGKEDGNRTGIRKERKMKEEEERRRKSLEDNNKCKLNELKDSASRDQRKTLEKSNNCRTTSSPRVSISIASKDREKCNFLAHFKPDSRV